MGSDYVRLEDIVDRVCVGFVGSCNKDYTNSTGIPMIRTTNLTDNGIKYEDLKYVTETFHQKNKKSQLCYGDILVARHGDNGLPSIYESNEEANCLNVVIVKPKINKDYVDNYYLLYALRSSFVVNQVKSLVGGSVQGVINTKAIAALNIPYPQRIVREEIVQQLKMLNKKIALNRQINQTLEQMAQTLFKSWFVDFDPVIDNALDATANGQNIEIPESLAKRFEARKAVRESEGFEPLPADIRQLFPCEFEGSELSVGINGFVPKGWGVEPLSSIANYGKNRILVSELTLENYISTENMLTEKKGISSAAKLPTVNSVPAYRGGNVLISNIRPYFKKIWIARGDGGYSNDVLGFEVKDENTEAYLFNLLYQDSFFNYMMTTSKGSKMPRGDKKAIMDLKIVIPLVTLRMFYSQKVAEFYESSHLRQLENKSLIELRDTLLPKLISGELRLDSPQGEALQQAVSAE